MVDFLCSTYGWRPFTEPNLLNPYLDDFYGDMSSWAFHSQISFLAHKFRIHMEVMAEKQTVVQDRTIYEDAEIFARYLYQAGYINDRDYGTYTDLYEAMKRALAPPDLLIRLDCSVRAVRLRIRKRGRPEEQDIPLKYIKSLQALYDDWFDRYDASPVLVINTERLDYIGDMVDRLEVRQALEPFLL
ncbi:MAG: deoxynucleoside kinase [Deltaproteobacteria bacterium]|nr:deoxynucleoside kinase [Deltaproteobacteria bacterium]